MSASKNESPCEGLYALEFFSKVQEGFSGVCNAGGGTLASENLADHDTSSEYEGDRNGERNPKILRGNVLVCKWVLHNKSFWLSGFLLL